MPIFREFVPLAPFTTFKVGGEARFFCEPTCVDELRSALLRARTQALSCWILGKGSNVVISDHGLDGLVIRLGNAFSHISCHENHIVAESGALLSAVVQQALRAGLGGIQKLGGVPGTVGGGAYINAGAYGQELMDTVQEVESLTRDGEQRTRSAAECGFAYRHSIFCTNEEVITRVRLNLFPAEEETLRAEMRESLLQRRTKQPLELPNAGSMFKRPPGHFAGALIEASGLKGFSVGGAQVSEKHAGFVVNKGGATAADIWELTERVIDRVHADHGVVLEREVRFLGKIP